jgi:predicted lactoylglutathione lyase
VPADGSGFRGVSLHFIVPSGDQVDEILSEAVSSRGAIVRPAAASQWGYFEYFSDPDGYLWKVAASA